MWKWGIYTGLRGKDMDETKTVRAQTREVSILSQVLVYFKNKLFIIIIFHENMVSFIHLNSLSMNYFLRDKYIINT